ncbi:MAG: NUDIX domain-containing protein [Candidatus Bathyarchaeota archaeon]|nr:NUDIX domain-containing protein [Candidatus Bathyarchaeota archaeon]
MEVQVAACGLIVKDNRFLLIRRAQSDEFSEKKRWTLPGSRVRLYEEPDRAVLREIKEETDLRISGVKPLAVWSGKKASLWRIGICYLCTYEGGEVRLSEEHDDFVWASLEDLDKINLKNG